MTLPEVETISWRDLTGNKYNKTLHPAMLSDEGYINQQAIRRAGDAGKTIFDVIYDHEYLLSYIDKHLCSKLFTLGKEEVVKLVAESWDTCYGVSKVRPTVKAANK